MSQTKKVCLQICKFSAQCPYFDETLGFAGFAHIVLQNFQYCVSTFANYVRACKFDSQYLQIWFSTMQAELHDSQPRRDNLQTDVQHIAQLCVQVCKLGFALFFCKHGLQVLPNSSSVSQIWTTKAWSAHLRTWWETIASLFFVAAFANIVCTFACFVQFANLACDIAELVERTCTTCFSNRAHQTCIMYIQPLHDFGWYLATQRVCTMPFFVDLQV